MRRSIRSRSQWPSGRSYELSSLARTLGSWVRIPLKVWMYVCVYSVFVLPCVGSGLATGWSPVQGVLPTVLGVRNWSETKCFMDALCSNVGATGKKKKKKRRCVRPVRRFQESVQRSPVQRFSRCEATRHNVYSKHRRTFSARPRVGICRQCARPRAKMRLMSVFLFRIKGRSCPNTRKHERPDYTSRAAQSLVSE
jgi:hypothetical protein